MNSVRFCTIVLFFFIGCTPEGEQGGIGPCVHIYKEPILHITSITNMITGEPVSAFTITDVRVDGRTQNLFHLRSLSYGVVWYDSILFANVPCGFGTDEGVYHVTISATGFRDTVIQAAARYAVFQGGCPSSNSGGTRISFVLQPIR